MSTVCDCGAEWAGVNEDPAGAAVAATKACTAAGAFESVMVVPPLPSAEAAKVVPT